MEVLGLFYDEIHPLIGATFTPELIFFSSTLSPLGLVNGIVPHLPNLKEEKGWSQVNLNASV